MRRLRMLGWGALFGMAVLLWAGQHPVVRPGIRAGLGVFVRCYRGARAVRRVLVRRRTARATT